MAQIAPLVHSSNASDEALVGEEMQFFAKNSPVQAVSELYDDLRTLAPPWWSPSFLREQKNALQRMQALESRPDLRQSIVTKITGLRENTARRMTPDVQANLIDASIDSGDSTLEAFEHAFSPQLITVYLDSEFYWRLFQENMTWEDNSELSQKILAKLLNTLLKERESGAILTPHDVLSRIPRKIWRSKIPQETLAEIDERLLALEADGSKLTYSQGVFQVAPPDVFVNFIPPDELADVINFAEKRMGFGPSESTESLTPEAPLVVTTTTPSTPETEAANGSAKGHTDDAPSITMTESEKSEAIVLDEPLDSPKA